MIRRITLTLSLIGPVICLAAAVSQNRGAQTAARKAISLNGKWQFQRDGAPPGTSKSVTVPASFESHEGIEFDGVGVYRTKVGPITIPSGMRALLHFQAAATLAEVWWNGKRLGEHLGGWTPFRFDVTDLVRAASPGTAHEIRVRLDEKVGHNTQGFLPIVAPHFGGIWQDVELILVPGSFIDDLRLLAVGNPATGKIELEIPVRGETPEHGTWSVTLRARLSGTERWIAGSQITASRNGLLHTALDVPGCKPWSPEEPNLYDVEITLGRDRITTRAAFRKIEIFGRQLRLNGRPLGVRGFLNWGYYPPHTAPAPGEATFRRDLELARSLGFNLMKFCLWVPPRRYLELADEMGMLTWIEYPTWHPQLTKQFLPELMREFEEFFWHDRNHPSVILRSLTCETGHGADLDVLQALYDKAHAMIPGAVVEDDSSWIGWNRIHDFYDDHPYGNNHTWVATLKRLNDHILAHGPKPLVLGEAIAADTWIDRRAILERIGDDRPFWLPRFFEDTARWEDAMRSHTGPAGLKDLRSESRRYALLMRKYQIETYRREVPSGGFVTSVIRDVPLCSMGFLDYLGRPKWSPAAWSWNRDTLLILKTPGDCRSFSAGGSLGAELLLSHFGPEKLQKAGLEVSLDRWERTGERMLLRGGKKDVTQNCGTLAKVMDIHCALPELDAPARFTLHAELKTPRATVTNQWPLWMVPRRRPERIAAALHTSISEKTAAALFPATSRWKKGDTTATVVTNVLDDDLLDCLEAGGRVLLLATGEKNSFPLRSHWFLRGAPFIPDHPLTRRVPRELLLELQHFDLAGPVIYDVKYLNRIDPILMLWDTHDLTEVKTHGLLFATRFGKGRLMVSALRHGGEDNAAGRWLLDELIRHLASGPAPKHGLTPADCRRLREKLHEGKIELDKHEWMFRPDPDGTGLDKGYHLADFSPDADWKPIRVDRHWEGQGWEHLDGWAWYRITVGVPPSWKGRDLYISFQGVDDYYDLYVNGKLAGSGGDLKNRITAFEERKSHCITTLAAPGKRCAIAIRVFDWQGAGGIFRPVTLGTVGFTEGGGEFLK